ncbi:DUF2793 domain-containing protein [Pseudomonas coleopterorum]|uniref:DUF2793 domain-containing protein n=1 Tax=Pseudomonas coleopterorum TaxID=1605838 RepID=UPI000894F7CE|nr:DUF2793 domain-containing protein [Pseudomonas coleopterorum]SEE14231.1 Protein of unknown function [Pseudomonas coleopterorum]
MTATNKLGLELLQNAAANQTLANTTFALLNQLVQAGVADKDLAAPPASPADESLYIVGASATGAWAGRDGQLAYWLITAGAWQFIEPREGFFLHVNDEDVFYKFTGAAWEVFSGGSGGGGDFKKDGSVQMTGAIEYANEVSVTNAFSGNVWDMGAANSNFVSATFYSPNPVITMLSSSPLPQNGSFRQVRFENDGTLKHDPAFLILPTGADIAVRAGDTAIFRYRGQSENKWECSFYQRADGTPLKSGAGFTEAQVRATPLTGLPATTGDVTETDSVLSGIGKLQASKVAKESGKILSTNDFTTNEKNKLAGIAEGAQVNSVTSVAGRTGDVNLAKGDVGLGNVTNTADADKPVSTAQQTALNAKVSKAGAESIDGVKTFSSSPIVPTPAASDTSASVANMSSLRSAMALFGIGTVNGPAISDANSANNGGLFSLPSNASNNPTATPSALLVVPFDSGGCLQICASLTSGQRLLWRTEAGGSFSAWQEVARITSPTFMEAMNVLSTTGNAGLRFGRQNGAASTPYFDFISGGANIGYDFRLIATGGSPSNTTVGTGLLSMLGAGLNIGTQSQNGSDRLTVAGSASFTGAVKLGTFTLTTLPSASAFSGCVILVSNATGGPKYCHSNGSAWQILNTTTTVS